MAITDDRFAKSITGLNKYRIAIWQKRFFQDDKTHGYFLDGNKPFPRRHDSRVFLDYSKTGNENNLVKKGTRMPKANYQNRTGRTRKKSIWG